MAESLRSPPMTDLSSILGSGIGPEARAWLRAAEADVARDGARALATLLPALPRRLGRTALARGIHAEGDARVELGVWRACDLGALTLLRAAQADDETLLGLFAHGDLEERAMLLRAATVRPLGAATAHLIGEAQRSNTVPHFEALCCECDLVARAHGVVTGFDADACNRLVLKAAFLGLRLSRLLDVERHATAELSRMLQDLATEREAAGRPIWVDTLRLAARAPVPGTLGRIIGDLEHGDDGRRLAAVEAAALVRDPRVRPFLEARAMREPKPAIRAACEVALASLR